MTTQSSKRHLFFSLGFLAICAGLGGLYLYLSDRELLKPDGLPATATGTTIVDLMVVYNQAADDLYQSDAVTRINHLIDVSNRIYQDSGVGLSLRLVHVEKVSYESGFDSETAIQHITHQTHPAFADIPTLREQHGADLVVLMRPNAGDGYCGLAWIGGNGTDGDFSHPAEKDYGFSTVSIDCGSYVLAHELGHNMGLNHSRKQDGSGGTFDFALGHGIDNDFVTVMAYSSAFNASKKKVFSNPQLTCGDAPCGIDSASGDGADAALTLNLVAPQIANYYAATSSAPAMLTGGPLDVDGDGTSDLVLQHVSGDWNLGTMNGARVTALHELSLDTDPDWVAVDRGDYDGDGIADILTRNASTGKWHVFLMQGNEVKRDGSLTLTANLDWQVAGTGDFNGDGKGDVLLRNKDGRWYQYFLDGISVQSTARPPLPNTIDIQVAAVGDFSGDGKTDVLTRAEDGQWHLYHMDGGDVKADQTVSMKKSLDWQVLASGDFDGNEKDDVLLRYKNGSWLVYQFDDFTVQTPGFLSLTDDLDWQLASVGDFDADGDTDILLRNHTFGSWRLYSLGNTRVEASEEVALTTDLDWAIPQT